MRKGKPSTRPRAPKAKAKRPDELTRVEYLRQSLQDAENMTADSIEAGSWQAAVAAKRLATNIRVELDAELAKQAPETESMSEAALMQLLRQAIAGMPEPILQDLEDALALRRGRRPELRVVGEES